MGAAVCHCWTPGYNEPLDEHEDANLYSRRSSSDSSKPINRPKQPSGGQLPPFVDTTFSADKTPKMLRSALCVPPEDECVMCLDTFDELNPEVMTLCSCGVNQAHFHLSCIYQWLEQDRTCPVCRKDIFFEEPSVHDGENEGSGHV